MSHKVQIRKNGLEERQGTDNYIILITHTTKLKDKGQLKQSLNLRIVNKTKCHVTESYEQTNIVHIVI